ncbi:hypothetical protein Tco_0558282, partial [Tanacetum coccineum]
KRIFRYLKSQSTLGLWYPKDSPIDLIAYSDSDYAGASLDRKSTTGGCQFLGCRLISWQCKKQTIVANSTTEAEYIAACNCCGQILWLRNQLLDYGYNFMQTKIHVDNESAICVVKNPVSHSKTKHIEIRYYFIRDSYEKRLIKMVKIHTEYNVADLLTKAFDVTRFQFLIASIDKKELAIPWQTATGKEFSNPLMADINDGEQHITVTVDGHTIAVTEASVRRHLQLADVDCISTFPNTKNFEQLTLMGPKKTSWEQFSSNIATAIICLATNRTFKFSKLIFDGKVKNVDSKSKFLMYPRFILMLLDKKKSLLKQHKKTYVAPSLTKKLFSNMKRGFLGERIPLFDSMLYHDQPGQGERPTLTVESQHTPIASPTTSQPTTSQPMSSQEPTTKPIPTTSSPPLHETTIPQTTSSMPHDSPLSGGDTLGSDEGSKKLNELTDLCTKLFDKVTSLENDLKQTKKVYGKALTKLVKKFKHLEDKLESTTERRKARMVILDDEEDLVSEDPSKQGRITETEYEDVETQVEGFEYELDQTDILQHITLIKVPQGEEQSQETSEVQLDVLSAAKILAEASRERVKTYDRRRRSTDSSIVSTAGGLFSTAKEILCTNERIDQKLNEEEKAKLDERDDTDNIDWNIVAEQIQERQSDTIKRYQTLKKKPVSVAQARKNMMIYLKNMAKYKMNYFKGMSYDEIRTMFEEEYRKLQTLFKKDTEVEKTKTKKVAEETLLQESFKKLRIAEASSSEPIQEQPTEEPKELSEEELKKMLDIVPVEETKAPYKLSILLLIGKFILKDQENIGRLSGLETSQRHIKDLKICSKDLTEKTLIHYGA